MKHFKSIIKKLLNVLIICVPVVAGDTLLEKNYGPIHLKVIERQGPNHPRHSVSFPAIHEITLSATRSGVRLDSFSINSVINTEKKSTSERLDGYIYFDQVPQRALTTLVLAEDSAKKFQWECNIVYFAGGSAHREKFSVSSSDLPDIGAGLGKGASNVKVSLETLFGHTNANSMISNDTKKSNTSVGLDALLTSDSVIKPSNSKLTLNNLDSALIEAEAQRKARREREAYQQQITDMRNGLLQESELLNQQMLAISQKHQAFDERIAEQERRERRAQEAAEDADSTRRMWALGLSALSAGVMANNGMDADNAAKFSQSVYNDVSGDAPGSISSFQQAYNDDVMSQKQAKLDQLKRENQQRQAALSANQTNKNNSAYYDGAARSEQMRQQLEREPRTSGYNKNIGYASTLGTMSSSSAQANKSMSGNSRVASDYHKPEADGKDFQIKESAQRSYGTADNESSLKNNGMQRDSDQVKKRKPGYRPELAAKPTVGLRGTSEMFFERIYARELAAVNLENQASDYCNGNSYTYISWQYNGCEQSKDGKEYKCWAEADVSCKAERCDKPYCGTEHKKER